ncbi:hypothetical protein PENTCL1PPCAC_8237, partial [Pristionchus entomophagus]
RIVAIEDEASAPSVIVNGTEAAIHSSPPSLNTFESAFLVGSITSALSSSHRSTNFELSVILILLHQLLPTSLDLSLLRLRRSGSITATVTLALFPFISFSSSCSAEARVLSASSLFTIHSISLSLASASSSSACLALCSHSANRLFRSTMRPPRDHPLAPV